MEPERTVKFEEDGLYIIISRQLSSLLLHWGLYLHLEGDEGSVFHIRNTSNDPTWYFEHKISNRIASSRALVFALRIAVVKPEIMHTALQTFLPTISMEDPNQYGQLTCQTWVMQALYEMDQGGYISIIPGYTVRDIADEADGIARQNASITSVPEDTLLRDSEFSKP